jgi:hypothetical protein
MALNLCCKCGRYAIVLDSFQNILRNLECAHFPDNQKILNGNRLSSKMANIMVGPYGYC